jgi:flagellar hook protein FlgE
MSLSTVLQTALSGMHAASVQVQTTANDVANLQTPGFKQSQVYFASAPPLSGVVVAGISMDPSQGAIVADAPLPLLALEGEGFFILEGRDGQQLFTRDGTFSLNARGELVTAGGERVLGFAADRDGAIDDNQLVPLSIPLGLQVAAAGRKAAALNSYSFTRGERIVGRFSDGSSRTLGQLRISRFNNPAGLSQRGGNKFQATAAAGPPRFSNPGEEGTAEVLAGATELSNVDLGRELIELTLAGNMFRANAAVFQAADTMLGELFFPWRR